MIQELIEIGTGRAYRRSGTGPWNESLQGASAADMLSYLGGVARSSIGKQIWQGSAGVGSTISVPELADYDIFAIYNNSSKPMVAMRNTFGGEGSGLIFGSFNSTDSGWMWIEAVSLEITSATSLRVGAYRVFDCDAGTFSDGTIKGIRGIL